jgi:hypothetical protein
MAIAKLTPPAFFYLAASAALNHGHAVWIDSSKIVGDNIEVELPLLGKLDCESTWDEESQSYKELTPILGVRDIDLLLQFQGRMRNKNVSPQFAGMVGWEEGGDYRRKTYSHRTATGRLRFVLVSWEYSEEIWIEIVAGDGKTAAAAIWQEGKWKGWFGDAEGVHRPFGDEMTIEKGLAVHNSTQRPDRFHLLTEMLFGCNGEYLLPGESLAEVEWLGIGKAVKACLEGKAFEIAEQYKRSQEPEENFSSSDTDRRFVEETE